VATPTEEELDVVTRELGLSDPLELLLVAPARYEDYRNGLAGLNDAVGTGQARLFQAIVKANQDGTPAIRGYVAKDEYRVPKSGYVPGVPGRRRQLVNPFEWPVRYLEIDVEDAQGQTATMRAFGGIRNWRQVPANRVLVLRGKVKPGFRGWGLDIDEPEWVPEAKIGEIQPVYVGPEGKGVSGERIGRIIDWILADPARTTQAVEAACLKILDDCGGMNEEQILDLCRPADGVAFESLPDLLVDLHCPETDTNQGLRAIQSVRKICALAMQCQAQTQNARADSDEAPIANAESLVVGARSLMARFEAGMGYKLTDNQRDIVEKIARRLADRKPLNGLLNGEVGAGKTAAFAIPAALAHKQGACVAIMAPTELLANQHAERLAQMFGPDVAIERVKTGGKIRNLQAILIGTAGLSTVMRKAGIEPNFLVLDEQHKIHTAARAELVAPHTHTLEVSATPIPRTLALSMYEGVDLFMLNEQPVSRRIKTSLLDESTPETVMDAMRHTLGGRQRVVLVFSLVEGKSESVKDRTSVGNAAAGLSRRFPNQVAVLHGKLKDAEKLAALEAFNSGKRPILVTTSIFETGIDVKDVRLLIVRNPEAMGLSQLHQLRGRLARNGGNAQCILLAKDLKAYADETRKRLEFFTKTQDGYALARQDLLSRDIGQINGLSQSGAGALTFKTLRLRAVDLLFEDHAELDMQVETPAEAAPRAARPAPVPVQRSLF